MPKDRLGNQDIGKPLGGTPGDTGGMIQRIWDAIKTGDPNKLTDPDSIAQQIKRKVDPERREREALEPTRQRTPPQTSHRDHYNDQEDYN